MPRPAAGSAYPWARVCLPIAGQAVPFPLQPLGRERLIRSLTDASLPPPPGAVPPEAGLLRSACLLPAPPPPSWRFLQEASQGCWGPRPATPLPGSLCFFPPLLVHVLIENKEDVGRSQTITGTTHLSLSSRDVSPVISAGSGTHLGPTWLAVLSCSLGAAPQPGAWGRGSPSAWHHSHGPTTRLGLLCPYDERL